jgi:hypothetical protein
VSGGDEVEIMKPDDIAPSIFPKKIRIAIACFGSFIALAIIISSVCIFWGLEGHLESIFRFLFTVGIPVWFLVTWKFFSRKLK